MAAADSQEHAGPHADAPRWTRNPAWALFSQTHAQRQLLLVSGGADEVYVVDEADTPTVVERILGHWENDTLAAVQDDAECGPAIRQLMRLGVLVPLAATRRVQRYALDWLGTPLPGLADAFDQHASADLQRVDAPAEADLRVLVRHGLGWEQALARYRAQMPAQPHLLVDISYHHTLALGPYVVPGQTACVYCTGQPRAAPLGRSRRAGDAGGRSAAGAHRGAGRAAAGSARPAAGLSRTQRLARPASPARRARPGAAAAVVPRLPGRRSRHGATADVALGPPAPVIMWLTRRAFPPRSME
ncbi:hypothetical protein V8017_06955 [Stenotrophomonas rhizophila]